MHACMETKSKHIQNYCILQTYMPDMRYNYK